MASVQIEEINSVQKRVVVEVPEEAVEKAFRKNFNKIQSNVELKGFRKGKAPLSLIKTFYGEHVKEQVFLNLVDSTLSHAIIDQKLHVVSAPVIEKQDTPEQGKAFRYSAVVDVFPKISVKDYTKIPLVKTEVTVSEEDLERELRGLQRRKMKATSLEATEEPIAAEGRLVSLNIKHFDQDTELSELNRKESIILGHRELIPEIENLVLGAKVGEARYLNHTFDSQAYEKIANKTILIDVTVEDVQKAILPAIDDELAKDYDFESLEKLKTFITTQIKENLEARFQSELQTSLFDQILARNPFEVPPSLVDKSIDEMIRSAVGANKKALNYALSNEEVRKSFFPRAKTGIQRMFLTMQIAAQENLTATEEEAHAFHGPNCSYHNHDEEKIRGEVFELTAKKVTDFLISKAELTVVQKKSHEV